MILDVVAVNNMTLQKVIEAAVRQRPKFKQAVGYGDHVTSISVPSVVSSIYRIAAGTLADIDDQSVMDLVPGLRLIHASELAIEMVKFKESYPAFNDYLPFLADYSSCYMAIDLTDGGVFRVAPEYGTSKVASSLEAYWQTVLACYNEGAFFLDVEGYLDFDFEREGQIGARINAYCEYWIE